MTDDLDDLDLYEVECRGLMPSLTCCACGVVIEVGLVSPSLKRLVEEAELHQCEP